MRACPEDLVLGVLHHLAPRLKSGRFTAERWRIHHAFAQLALEQPHVSRMFMFRTREAGPESEVLDQALSNLEYKGVLRRYNQAPKYYEPQPQLDQMYARRAAALAATGIGEGELQEWASRMTSSLRPGRTR